MQVLTLRSLRIAALGALGALVLSCSVGTAGPTFPGPGGRLEDGAPGRRVPSRELQGLQALSDGATELAEGRPGEALLAFDRAEALGLRDGMLHFLRGVAHLDLGHGEAAVAELEQALSGEPGDVAAYSALARAWRSLGDSEAALAALDAGVDATAGDPRLMLLQGHIQLELGLLSDAYETLRRVAELDPDCLEAHRGLGVLFAEVGDAERAELSWRSALRLAPGDALLLAGLGNAQRDQGRDAEALDSYRAAADAEPDNSVHLANVASSLLRLGRLPEARATYERVLLAGTLPAEPRSYVEMNLGVVLERMGEDEGAMAAYESAVSGNPDLGSAHEALGLLLLDRRDEAHALEHLQAALESANLSAEAALYLGLLADRSGEPEITRQCARLLAFVGETDSVAAFRHAQLIVRADDAEVHDPRTAIGILRRLLDGPCADDGAVWNVLGEALASEGSFEEAAQAAGRALQAVDPDDPVAGHYRQQRSSYLAQVAGH